MKKTLSRYSFYLFIVAVSARLAFRAIKIAAVIYFRAIFETRFNFTLVNGVFLHTSKTIFDQDGDVNPEYLPYMTEALQVMLVLGDTNPEPYEFTSKYAQRLTSMTITPEILNGKIIDIVMSLFVTRSHPEKVLIPHCENRSTNEICYALWLGFPVHSDYFRNQALIDKILACRMEFSEFMDCQANPKAAKQIVESGVFEGSGWAKKGSINTELFGLMSEKEIPVHMNRLVSDDLLLSRWASLATSESFYYLDPEDLKRIIAAARKYSEPISAELDRRYGVEMSLMGLPASLVKKAVDVQDDKHTPVHPPLFPTGWRSQGHTYHKTTLIEMFKSGDSLLKAQALAICKRHHKFIDLGNLSERCDDPDLYILHQRLNWRSLWGCYQEKHYPSLPIFIRHHPKIIRHYAKKGLDMDVLMTEMGAIEKRDFYPRAIRKATTKKLMRIALIKGCPYAIFRISTEDESLLLDSAKEYPEYELIFNFCQNKRSENLNRYPGRLRDKKFGMDLGL